MRTLLFVTCIFLVFLFPGCARDRASTEEREEVADIESPFGDLTAPALGRLMEDKNWRKRQAAGATLAGRKDVAIEERVELLALALQKEFREPASGLPGPGSGNIPSHEQARLGLTWSMSDLGPEAIPALRQLAREVPPGPREYVLLALAELGDREALEAIEKMLTSSPNPWLRMSSANVLGDAAVEETIPLLIEALEDPYSYQGTSCIHRYEVYPVREAAARGLKSMGVTVNRHENGTFQLGE